MTIIRFLASNAGRGAAIGVGCLIATLVLSPTAAQSNRLEAAYVILGSEGTIVRGILTDAAQCPTISIGNVSHPMSIRAKPDTGSNPPFPVLVCEALLPPGTSSASLEGQDLPLPKGRLNAIAVFGDTGCRLKAARNTGRKNQNESDEPGTFQDCDMPSKWPFSRVSRTVAARKPDLVIHVGDYLYRESPCPKGNRGCKSSPYGDNWRTWKTDFFSPAGALLAVAPWIMTRGNHEICERAGAGFFRFLDPGLAHNETPPTCTDLAAPYTVTLAGKSFIIMDSSNADDGCNESCNSAPYAAQFAGLQPVPGSVFISHRPIWGIGRTFILNQTLQQALKAWKGKLPEGIDLAIAGHMHTFEMLSFDDKRSPQLIVGTGGTYLDKRINRRLTGMKIGGTTVRSSRIEREWGFVLLAPHRNDTDWTVTFHNVQRKSKFTCILSGTEATCGRP